MKNRHEVRGEETAIFLNYKGQMLETIIDTEDLEKVMQMPNEWYAVYDKNIKGYYVYGWWKTTIYIHRLIMNTPKNLVVDHINHNTLYNRKHKMRNVTKTENSQNMLKENIYESMIIKRARYKKPA